MYTIETIGDRISAIIDRAGLTKTDFAKKIGLSQPFISNLCTGEKTPSDRTISDICREFDVDEHWLRTGEGEMFIQKSRSDEIAAFMGDILREEPDFRQRLIAVLARMTPEQWKLLEQVAVDLDEEAKKEADP